MIVVVRATTVSSRALPGLRSQSYRTLRAPPRSTTLSPLSAIATRPRRLPGAFCRRRRQRHLSSSSAQRSPGCGLRKYPSGRAHVLRLHKKRGRRQAGVACSPRFDKLGGLPSFVPPFEPAPASQVSLAGSQACDKTRTLRILWPLRFHDRSGRDKPTGTSLPSVDEG